MSLLKANAVQLGQSLTASQNFTWYQPASPDGTVRLGNGNAGSVTDLITVGSTGNLTLVGTTTNFSATAARITGYFGPTLASRVVFQSSSANTNTQITTFPSGTATNSGFDCYSTNDGTNASRGLIRIDTAGPDFRINSDITGTGTYLPITFFTSGTERMRLDASGNLGLGVTPANAGQHALQIANYNATVSALSLGASASDYGVVGYNFGFTGTAGAFKYVQADSASGIQFTGSTIKFLQAGSGAAGATLTPTQAMTLDASGNLLVGPTSVGVNYPVSQIKSNIFTGNLTVSVAALNTNYGLSISAAAGILVIRDNTAGGSALWLLDPNGGALQISSNIGKTITFLYTGGQWVIKQTAGAVTTQYAYSVLSVT